MPLTIDNLTSGTPVEATLEIAGDKLHVKFNPSAITGEMVQATQAAIEAGPAASFQETCRQLSLVILEWDLLQRDPKKGEPKAKVPRYPTTAEALAKLPVAVVYELSAKLGEAQRPPEGGSFGAG